MLDYAKREQMPSGYLISDLEACYNKKLPKIGGLVEETMGANRKMMIILSKVFPKCYNCMGTAHRIGERYYGGVKNFLGATGQGIFFWKCMQRHIMLNF